MLQASRCRNDNINLISKRCLIEQGHTMHQHVIGLNAFGNWQYRSNAALAPRITFSTFQTEAGWDFVNFYDGDSTSAQRLVGRGRWRYRAAPSPAQRR